MRILNLDYQPLLTIPYVSVAPDGKRIEQRDLAVLQGTVDELPEGVDALLVTSDLQG